MTTVVIDASFAGAWVLQDESSAVAEALLRRALEGEVRLVAPELWTYEMINLLAVAVRRRRLGEDAVFRALGLLASVPLSLEDHRSALARERTLRLAVRFGLSAYDAAYLELADRLQHPLRTNDSRLKEAALRIGLPADAR